MIFLNFKFSENTTELLDIFKGTKQLHFFADKKEFKIESHGIFTLQFIFKKEEFDIEEKASFGIDTNVFLFILKSFERFSCGISDQIIFLNDKEHDYSIISCNIIREFYEKKNNTEDSLTIDFLYENTENCIISPFLEITLPEEKHDHGNVVIEFMIDVEILNYFYTEKTKYIFDEKLTIINTTHQHEEQTKIEIEYIMAGKFEFECNNQWIKNILSIKTHVKLVVFEVYENCMVVTITFKENQNTYTRIHIDFLV
ncbi:hypothetical protein EHP00_1622 [Ecytonucleospora hepatopenaei]|uniref:Uncharacterized protein n=1 Tax=Ecytonucleospora hepatopenaei TaxID=646526 RepID=A0A1W0E2C4_9MICR|nr:hypothetical protein EHP00_1622 [Ecytonucleospora hepatopenaei]